MTDQFLNVQEFPAARKHTKSVIHLKVEVMMCAATGIERSTNLRVGGLHHDIIKWPEATTYLQHLISLNHG